MCVHIYIYVYIYIYMYVYIYIYAHVHIFIYLCLFLAHIEEPRTWISGPGQVFKPRIVPSRTLKNDVTM